jgi:hypothetical protein
VPGRELSAERVLRGGGHGLRQLRLLSALERLAVLNHDGYVQILAGLHRRPAVASLLHRLRFHNLLLVVLACRQNGTILFEIVTANTRGLDGFQICAPFRIALGSRLSKLLLREPSCCVPGDQALLVVMLTCDILIIHLVGFHRAHDWVLTLILGFLAL